MVGQDLHVAAEGLVLTGVPLGCVVFLGLGSFSSIESIG